MKERSLWWEGNPWRVSNYFLTPPLTNNSLALCNSQRASWSLTLKNEYELAKQLCSQKIAWAKTWQHMVNLGNSKEVGISGAQDWGANGCDRCVLRCYVPPWWVQMPSWSVEYHPGSRWRTGGQGGNVICWPILVLFLSELYNGIAIFHFSLSGGI